MSTKTTAPAETPADATTAPADATTAPPAGWVALQLLPGVREVVVGGASYTADAAGVVHVDPAHAAAVLQTGATPA